MRELAHRCNGGVDVTLLWHPDTQELMVCVCDELRGVYFEFEPRATQALDAFYHPYPHASVSSTHDLDGQLAA